jgi:hypothetical protein
MSIRISIPDLQVEQQIHQAGLGLINLFGEDLFRFIDEALSIRNGKKWLLELQKTDFRYQSGNFKDPSTLLKDIIRNSNSPFRGPLKDVITQKDSVQFYNRLQIILEDRNDWVHHQVQVSEETLKTLAMNIAPIATRISLSVLDECNMLINLIDFDSPPLFDDAASDSSSPLSSSGQSSPSIQKANGEEFSVGERINDEFLDHSYTLQLSGSVKDRKSGLLLEELRGSAGKTFGKLLLERKPNGGRLRVTAEGIIAGYFDEHWGYIATTSPQNWFPSHLS